MLFGMAIAGPGEWRFQDPIELLRREEEACQHQTASQVRYASTPVRPSFISFQIF